MNRAQGNVAADLAPTFTAETAAVAGRSARAVELDAERGTKVIPFPDHGRWPAPRRDLERVILVEFEAMGLIERHGTRAADAACRQRKRRLARAGLPRG